MATTEELIQEELIEDEIPEEIFDEMESDSSDMIVTKKDIDIPISQKSITGMLMSTDNNEQLKGISRVKEILFSKHINTKETLSNKQLNDKQIFKSKVFKYLPLITSDIFNNDKLIIKEKESTANDKLHTIVPVYTYDSKNEELMIIQTSFMNVNKKNILYFHKMIEGKQNKKFEINFAAQFFDNEVIDMLIDYETKVTNYVKSVYGNDMKNNSRIVYNIKSKKNTSEYEIVNKLDQLGNIRCKINPDRRFKQYGKLISYNISKKYGYREEFDLNNYEYANLANNLDRILNDKKQMRLLITPITYVSLSNKRYMSYLKIMMMEVKYKDAKIFSPLDKNGVNVRPEVTKITI
jgi:hypothetical protein